MAPERYLLKHCYYGQFVKRNKPVGDMRLLAKTNGISDAVVAEMLQLAMVPPPKAKEQRAWAVVRGKQSVPFILVDSRMGAAGQSLLHFVSLPAELVRVLGGNWRLFLEVLGDSVPEYDRVGNPLTTLALEQVRVPDTESEIDAMLDLMTFTRNQMPLMESLLGAVVQGMSVIVVNAPADFDSRLSFISGVLVLLPPSVRFAVTFATHTLPSTRIDVQVRFVDGEVTPPANTLLFDWKARKLHGEVEPERYSRFIMSQLRLDAELVVRQTRQLTGIASWRVKQGARLADALAYASQRMSIDDAVLNNQPVEASEVAKVLASDPTLSDELRFAYARHLLSLAVALGELEYAEPLGTMLRKNIDLADHTYRSLREALTTGAAGDIYDLLAKWLASPSGPQTQRWFDLAHEAAVIYLGDIVTDGDRAEATLLLRDVDRAGVSVSAEELMPRLLAIAEPLAEVDGEMAQVLFLLACRYYYIEQIETLMNKANFRAQMPAAVRTYAQALAAPMPIREQGLLVNAVKAFKASRRLVMVRLAEWALRRKHPEVIDENVLKQLTRVAEIDWGIAYTPVILRAVDMLSAEDNLKRMSRTGQRLLLAVLLAFGAYKELARRMIQHSSLLYPPEKQPAYALMVENLFSEFPIPEAQIPDALETLIENGIRSLPLVMAFIGVMNAHEKPNEITDAVAGDVTDMIQSDYTLTHVLPVQPLRKLLMYHARRRDVAHALPVMTTLADVASRYGEESTRLMGQIYERMTWHEQVISQRMEMLRRYIRYMERDAARSAVDALGKMLGKEVRTQLEATYALKQVMDDVDLVIYGAQLRTATAFCHDTAAAYNRNTPTQRALDSELDSMPGGINSDEMNAIADNIIAIGTTLCDLGDQHRKVRQGTSDKRIEALVQADTDPESVVEVLRVMGGYFAEGKHRPVKLPEHQHPHPFPKRTGPLLLDEVRGTHHLLACQLEVTVPISAGALRSELDGIWQDVPNDQHRELRAQLEHDLQWLADLILHIASRGDRKALENSGLGRKLEANRARPRSTLELYRYVAGYYRIRS